MKYKAPVSDLKNALPNILPPEAAEAFKARYEKWSEAGAPDAVAREAAMLPALEHAFDVVDLAAETGWSNPGVGSVFFAVGRTFMIEAMRQRARKDPPDDHFEKIAMRQIIEELADRQRHLTRSVIGFISAEPRSAPNEWVGKLLSRWAEAHSDATTRYQKAAGELDLGGAPSVGKFTLMTRKLDELIALTS